RAAASLARVCSIGHSTEFAPSGTAFIAFQISGSAHISPATLSARCAHGSVAGSASSNSPNGAIRASFFTESGQIAAISAASAPPTELAARSAPTRSAFASSSRTASTQSSWLSSTEWPRSPPGKPGSDGTITVRFSASLSRNGTQRGSPPNPARKPSLGPLPLRQTRVEKPLTSTVNVSGSLTGYSKLFRLHDPSPNPLPEGEGFSSPSPSGRGPGEGLTPPRP